MRILPVVIGAAAVALTIRAAELYQRAGLAFAQQPQQQSGQGQPAAATPAQPAAARPPAAAAGQAPARAAGAAPAQPAAAPAAPAAPARITLDPDQLTASEIEVLQDLANRRAAIDQRAADLERREALLRAAEQRIDAQLQELRQLQGSVETALRRVDEQEEQRRRSLVRMFETMRPPEAARIFEQMEMPVLLDLVERMREAKAAPILAQLNPIRARQIASELARRRVPGTQSDQPADAAAAPTGAPPRPPGS
ncbi:MAG: hypothetical protein JNL66_05735 [Alphaproteobacteria bacterium]|nr:hypothetical protein [Alphaproteobacteria bacterium]